MAAGDARRRAGAGVARPAALRLWLLPGVVLLAHVVGLEWFARQGERITLMPLMAPPMYTRMLQPVQPPPVVAAAPAPPPQPSRPSARVPPPRPKASQPQAPQGEPEPVREIVVQETVVVPPPEPQAPDATAPPAPAAEVATAPQAAASAPAVAASGPAVAASAAAGAELAAWPTDTRLTYQLTGEYRGGPLFGDARVSWQRVGDKYQVRLDAAVKVLGRTAVSQTLTSQGEVTAAGLLPRAYEEYRPGKRRAAQFGDHALALENGKTAPRPAGMQDTASQFVELGYRFATGRERLEVGHAVSFWMARPGAVDQWTYDIDAREIVQTPTLGDVEAWHLKPRPIANPRGNITAEMWFAPSLQYLPVRIKVLMGDADYLDLVVEQIEQR